MMKINRGKGRLISSQLGFTLIEMAIVLIIIGIILGAVIKGKDLIQSGKQKKFYTKFLKQWELAVLNYYDRTGKLLGDGNQDGGSTPSRDGKFDNVDAEAFESTINDALEKVGLTVPTSNTSNSGMYSYKGQYSGTQTITLGLYYQMSQADGRGNNVLLLRNMPTDLAIALDTIIDGSVDASKGSFRRSPDTSVDWPDASKTPVVDAQYILDVP